MCCTSLVLTDALVDAKGEQDAEARFTLSSGCEAGPSRTSQQCPARRQTRRQAHRCTAWYAYRICCSTPTFLLFACLHASLCYLSYTSRAASYIARALLKRLGPMHVCGLPALPPVANGTLTSLSELVIVHLPSDHICPRSSKPSHLVSEPKVYFSGRVRTALPCPRLKELALTDYTCQDPGAFRMEVNDEAVARFMSAAHCDAEQAQFFLEACGGNHDRALHMFLGGPLGCCNGSGGASRPPPPPPSPPPCSSAPSQPATRHGCCPRHPCRANRRELRCTAHAACRPK